MPMAARVGKTDIDAVFLDIRHLQNARVVRQGEFAEGVDLQSAEAVRKRQLLVRRNGLIAKDDDRMFIERGFNFRECVRRHILGQIHAYDFSADGGCAFLDFHGLGHGVCPLFSFQ